jgi:two-component SAPR family response regulator
MAKQVLVVEDDVAMALVLEAILSKAMDAENPVEPFGCAAKRLIERAVDLALLEAL